MHRMAEIVGTATADELLRLPDNGFRYELVRGELRRMSPAGFRHGEVALRLGSSLSQHVRAHGLGRALAAETGFLLASNPDTVRAPDVAFVREARVPSGCTPSGFWPGTPDLAAEVVSPGDSWSEVREKVRDWLDAGCAMVLVLDPRERSVTVFRDGDVRILLGHDVLEGGEVVPGWTVPVRELFPD